MKIMFGVWCFQIFHVSSLFLDKASSSMLLANHTELDAQETSNRYLDIYIYNLDEFDHDPTATSLEWC